MARLNSKLAYSILCACIAIAALLPDQVFCGGNKGNKGGSDIILYKNNLLIRGNKGKGNLLIAGEHHGGHHGEHHGGEHHGGEHHHHGHKEHNFIMDVIREGSNKGKGNKGNKGKAYNQMGGSNMKSKGGNDMAWEQLLMGGHSGSGGHGF